MQLKAGHTATAGELIGWLRERTPERAAVPVALHLMAAMPLTAVGKIFKPALRIDAIGRVAEQLLQQALAGQGVERSAWAVAVVADTTHGQLIRVALAAAPGAQRQALEQAVHDALGPLTVYHEVVAEGAAPG